MDVCVRGQSCVLPACWAVAAFGVCCAAADGSGSVLTARKNTELPDIPPSASPPPTAAPPRFSITALARALPFPPRVKSMSTEAASRGPSFPFAFAAAPVKPPPLALLTADGRITHHHRHHHLASTLPLARQPSRTWHRLATLPGNPLLQRKHYAKCISITLRQVK